MNKKTKHWNMILELVKYDGDLPESTNEKINEFYKLADPYLPMKDQISAREVEYLERTHKRYIVGDKNAFKGFK